ncbi:hypothetical protein FDP41_000604 [Naegleria fowleri]|uniref:Calponin-homology (CH) domain-containing protein n=1 Tax=Naegleria fowleri TaxID=5763 RepID=A0A6A5CHD7_NAEFO|nr:uncharacterized protein FDP41_000604 [Naegleria fowleri]KAF0984705.1 hypothetical protein FDP41_000604 [Naegleria fowleri]CAG4710090.1 unnamed protein product [Naegleria fowleri]
MSVTKMDLSIAEKKAYDFLVRQEEAKRWIEELVQENLPPGTANFGENLRDGIFLAKLGKIFAPSAIKKINTPKSGSVLEFMAVDNITQFFEACKKVNFPDHYVFEVTDLWELKNIYKVVHCLHTLSLHLYRNGLAIRMQNLQKANLKFSREEIEKTQKLIEDIADNAMAFPVDIEEVGDEGTDSSMDDVLEDLADPSMCDAEGDGLTRAVAGVEASFTITARDSDGQVLTEGNETFRVTLFSVNLESSSAESGNSDAAAASHERVVIQAQVKNNNDGTYSVTYTPEKAGQYRMELVLWDEETQEEVDQLSKVSPQNVTVLSNPKSDPSKSVLDGAGIGTAVAGVKTEFTLTSFDKYGNLGRGGEKFTAKLTSGSEEVECDVEDLGQGKYRFSYVCPKSGDYSLNVKLEDVDVATKTVVVKDAGISDPSRTEFSDIDSVLDKKAGEVSKFTILAKDKHGNDRSSGGEKFQVFLLDPQTNQVHLQADVRDSNDGKYHVEYTANTSGKYLLQVKLGDEQVTSKNVSIHDSGVTDPYQTTFRAAENYKHFPAGCPLQLHVEARDRFGNKRETGGDTFILQFTSKATMETISGDLIKFNDNQNGEYTFDYTIEQSGEYGMEVLLKENVDSRSEGGSDSTSLLKAFLRKYKYTNIPGFPSTVFVDDSGRTDPQRTQFAGDGVSNAVQGKESEFVIKTRDNFNNIRQTGGDKVEVTVSNEARKIDIAASVKDNQDGTYTVVYTPKASGKTKLIVKINDVLVDNDILRGGVFVSPPNIEDTSMLDTILDHDLLSALLNAFKVENDSDSLIEKIQKLREELIKQIRENTRIEENVRDKDRKIALLAENRYDAETILNQKGGIVGFFQRRKQRAAEENANVDSKDKFNIKDYVDYYSSLFYLLQTNPKYLAKCLFLVPARDMDQFMQTVTLTLYGYAFSPREEYLILNLFNETLALEIQNSSIDNFLNNNPVLIKLVVNYCHERIQGKQFLQKVLYDKILEPIIEEKDLNLNLNAVTILKERISQQEVETGVKSDINIKDMTYEKAMQDEYVSKLVQQRTKKMIDICQSVLDTLNDNIAELPYGLRYVCRQLKTMLTKKNPEAPEEDVNRVVSYLLFFRFLNGPFCGCDAYNLTKKKISASMRNNLAWISKVLMRVSTFKEFDKTFDIHFCVMNDWIQQAIPSFVDKFLKPAITIPEPEEQLGVHQYIELTQKKSPTITITLNEIAQTHSLLVKFMNRIAPDEKDPLREVLEKMKDKVPEQVEASKNEEISLPLQVRTNIENLDLEMKPEQIYELTKECFRTLLRIITPQQLGDNVAETIEKADKYADELMNAKSSDGAQLKRKVEDLRKHLPKLVESEVLSKENGYRKLLTDITKEIQNRGEVRKKQVRELERLSDSLKSLKEHQTFLKEKDKSLDDYVQQTLRNYFEGKNKRKQKSGKKQVYKFSYEQLYEKYKVIAEMTEGGVLKKKIKFHISMDEANPGFFTVEAKLAGAELKTINLRLDELLDKRGKGEQLLKLDGVSLNVNMTIHMMNKLFASK